MGIALSAEIRALLDGPNFAHLATVLADGSPHATPVWVGREGDRVLLGIGDDSVKGRSTRRDPRVALSLVDVADPYRVATLRGRVVERRPDPEDGRKFYLYMTPEGAKVIKLHKLTVEAAVRRVMSLAKSDEVEATERVLGLLAQELM